MIDLIFLIAIVIINLVVAQIGFVIFRYFILRCQKRYEAEVEKLKNQMKNGKLSTLLFRRMQEDLKEKYHVQFFEKWWRRR